MKILNSITFSAILLTFHLIPGPAYSTEIDVQYLTHFHQSDVIGSDWNHRKLIHIYQTLADYVPEGWVFGPVETSCWYASDQIAFDADEYAKYWYVTFNPEDCFNDHAILQIWEPPLAGEPPRLMQEFTTPGPGSVSAICWLLLDDEPVLYTITSMFHVNTDVATFRLSPGNPRINILSEEIPRDVGLWLIPDLDPVGPVFVYGLSMCLSAIDEFNTWGYRQYGIMTWRGDGFFTSNIFELRNLLSQEEADLLEIMDDNYVINWALLTNDGLPESMEVSSRYDPVTRNNLDGTPFFGNYSFAKHYGWEETDLDEH